MSQLVLARTAGESIAIGDEVVVTVVSIRGGCVRLRVTAPRRLDVWRTDNRHDKPTEGEDPHE